MEGLTDILDIMKKRIKSMDTRGNDLQAGTAQLKASKGTTDQKSVKQLTNTLTLMEELKVDYDETTHKMERLRMTMNSIPSIEYTAIERHEPEGDDPFFKAVSISESVFTYDTLLLPSVEIRVIVNNQYVPVRAVVHLGSAFHMITNTCRQRLNLPLFPAKSNMDPTDENTTGLLGTTLVTFIPHFSNSPQITVEAYVSQNPFIVSPPIRVHHSIKDYLSSFQLADRQFDIPGEIELIFNMLPYPNYEARNVKYHLPGTNFSIFDSSLGWAVVGRAPVEEIKPSMWTTRVLDGVAKKLEEAEEYFREAWPGLLPLL